MASFHQGNILNMESHSGVTDSSFNAKQCGLSLQFKLWHKIEYLPAAPLTHGSIHTIKNNNGIFSRQSMKLGEALWGD